MFLGAVLDNTIGNFTTALTTDLFRMASKAGSPPTIRWNFQTAGYIHPGDYTLTMKGRGTIDFSGKIFQVGSGEPITIPVAKARGTSLYLTVQKQDAADPIRDIRFYPSNLDPTTQTFHPEYLKRVQGLYVLRSLHFYDVESNQYGGKEKTWDQAQVWRWELFIELCNTVGARPWINLPYMADRDYCRNLGALFGGKLDRGLKPYVADSNEIWNNGFPFGTQTGWFRTEGAKIGINNYRAAYAHFANLALSAFQEGFGRPMTWTHEGQLADSSTIKSSVAYARANGWRVDCIAPAPYVNPPWRYDPVKTPNPKVDFRKLAPLWLAAKPETMEAISPTPPPPPPPPPPPIDPPPIDPPPVDPPPVVPPVEPPADPGPAVRPPAEQPPPPDPAPVDPPAAAMAVAAAPAITTADQFLSAAGARQAWCDGMLGVMEDLITAAYLEDIDVRLDPQMRSWRAYADSQAVEMAYYEWGQGMIWNPADPLQIEIGTYMQRSEGMARVVEHLFEVSGRYASCACQTGFIGPWGSAQWFGMLEHVMDSTPKFDMLRTLVARNNP